MKHLATPTGGFNIPKPSRSRDPLPKGPFIIQGQPAGSTIEYFVSIALNILKTGYYYQYPVLGGRFTRGGSVVDFMVYTVPQPTPLYVQGDYWHGAAAKKSLDKWTLSRIRPSLYYQVADPVMIWEHEALSPDMALMSLRRILHL